MSVPIGRAKKGVWDKVFHLGPIYLFTVHRRHSQSIGIASMGQLCKQTCKYFKLVK